MPSIVSLMRDVMLCSRLIFLVRDVVEPGDNLAVLIGLLHGDVRHVALGCGAVPVLFTRLDVDDVTGADLLHPAACGHEANTVGDVERLTLGVVVPSGAGAW